MGWRFRRSVRILPGVKMNVGKSGVTSFTLGHGLNVNKQGYRSTIDVPFVSGLSYQGKRTAWKTAPEASSPSGPVWNQGLTNKPYRPPTANRSFVRFLIWLGLVLFGLVALARLGHAESYQTYRRPDGSTVTTGQGYREESRMQGSFRDTVIDQDNHRTRCTTVYSGPFATSRCR